MAIDPTPMITKIFAGRAQVDRPTCRKEDVVSNPLYGQLVEPAYRTGLAQRPLADLRAMRLECEHAEAAVSFTRRVLHGRLDILSGERQRRTEGAPRPAPVAGE